MTTDASEPIIPLTDDPITYLLNNPVGGAGMAQTGDLMTELPKDTAFWDFEKVPVLGDIYTRHASWALLHLAEITLSIDLNIATLAYFYYLKVAQGNFVFDELDFQDDPKLVRILSLAMKMYNVQQEDKMYTDYIADVLLEEWPQEK